MKKLIIALIVGLLCITPFVAAESLASMMNSYGKAKAHYNSITQELEDCKAADDDCSDIEEDILNPAIRYASTGINIMLMYIEYAGVETGKAELKSALDDFQYVQSKEDFDAIIEKVKTAWASVEGNVKGKAVGDSKNKTKDLVEKGKLIDKKLKCGIDSLTASSSELDEAYESFSADIKEANEKIIEAEELLDANNVASAMVAITEAQQSLTNSKTALATATNALTEKGGSLCAEVVIEEEVEQAEEETTEESEEETIEESEEETKDINELIDKYNLESYYDDAEEAIEDLIDYIEEKQNQGYDTSKADTVLAEAEAYMSNAENLILNSGGSGALSKLLNAKQTAERGLNSEYYKKLSSTTTSGSSDYQAFIECMEDASYAYQKDNCYEDYSVSTSTQEDINDCLDTAVTESQRMDCYAEAEDEAQEDVVGDEEELNDRIDALNSKLDDIEDAVTDLYDELSASGESSSSDDYRDIDAMIDSLLSDVQSSIEDYNQNINDIQADIDNENYDDADDALDAVEEEVDEFVDDTENEIEDIQDEINAL